MKKKKILLILVPLLVLTGLFFLFKPKELKSATLTVASATLSNSRLSFYGKVNLGASAGETTIEIDSTDNADNDIYGLFPGDTVAIGINGNETVGTIIDGTNFALANELNVTVADQAAVYATQSGSLTVVFTITNDIPANGYLLLTIPDPASNQDDGAPDTTTTVATNGFDSNGIAASDIGTSGGTGCTWDGTETWTSGSGSGHTYKYVTSTICTAGAITIAIDDDPGLVNPAPVNDAGNHTRGEADEYTLNIATYNSGDQLIDSVNVMVAPVEAVLVSATVEEKLTFTISGVGVGTTACDVPASVTTQAYSVPWGTLDTADSFVNASHDLEVSTNADGGYKVKVLANDQMGKDGVECNNAGAEDYTVNCIEDTTCDDATCDHDTSVPNTDDWDTESGNAGLGYSLDSTDGSDAKWEWSSTGDGNCGTGTFCAAHFADDENSQATQEIMSQTTPVDSSNIYVCYRITISNLQPAGYYYNYLTYTATPTF